MSKKAIAGLIVEIGGDTTKLDAALKGIDKRSADVSRELGEINRLLKYDPSNTELLAQKQKVLADAIKEAQERLALLKESKEQVNAAFERGEVSDDQMRALQREIEATEGRLKSYENAVIETGEAQKTAWRESREGLVKMGEAAERGLDRLMLAADKVLSKLTRLAFDAAAAADEISDMSKVTGLSTDQLQRYDYAAKMLGTSLEVITSSHTKLTRSMSKAKKGAGEQAAAFRRLGVDVQETSGELRDAESVFAEVLTALGAVENSTERDALAMSIFGKSAKELNPIITAGANALNDYGREAEALGAVLSAETIETLTAMQDEVKRTRAQLDALKNNVGAQFAPIMTTVLQKLQKLVTKGRELVDTPRIKRAIEKLRVAVEKFLDGAVDAGLRLLPTLLNVLTFLVEHFKGLSIAVVAAWSAFKGVKIVKSAIELYNSARTALAALKTATTAAKAAQDSMNASMTASRAAAGGWIGAIVAVVAALGALLVKSAKDSQQRIEELTASSSELKGRIEDISATLSDARRSYYDTFDATEAASRKAIDYINRLAELEKQGSLTAEEQREYNATVASLRALMPELNTALDANTGKLKAGANALKEQVEQIGKRAKLHAAEALLVKQFEKQLELELALAEAQKQYNKHTSQTAQSYRELVEQAQGLKALGASETVRDMLNANLNARQYEAELGIAVESTREFDAVVNAAAESLAAAQAAYEQNARDADQLAQSYSAAAVEAGAFADKMDAAGSETGELAENLSQMNEEAEAAATEYLAKLTDAAKNMFDVIDTGNARSMPELIENLRKNREAIDSWHDNLKIIYERGGEDLMRYLEAQGLGAASTVATIAKSSDEEFEALKRAWEQNIDDAAQKGKEYADMLTRGVESGISENISRMKAAAKRAATAVAHQFAEVWEINSPSRLTDRFAHYLTLGAARRLERDQKTLEAAGERAAMAVGKAFESDIPPDYAALDRHIAERSTTMRYTASKAVAHGSTAVLEKLDRILDAVAAGQVIALDGGAVVGGTAGRMDATLGERAILSKRSTLSA